MAGTLLQREGNPLNVAEAVVFLLENDYITGVCLPVDGGRSNIRYLARRVRTLSVAARMRVVQRGRCTAAAESLERLVRGHDRASKFPGLQRRRLTTLGTVCVKGDCDVSRVIQTVAGILCAVACFTPHLREPTKMPSPRRRRILQSPTLQSPRLRTCTCGRGTVARTIARFRRSHEIEAEKPADASRILAGHPRRGGSDSGRRQCGAAAKDRGPDRKARRAAIPGGPG